MSKLLIIPFVGVVAGQVLYHTILRQLPKGVSAFALISMTYAIAGLVGLVLWWVVPSDNGMRQSSVLDTLPWAALLALGILLVEVGYVYAYRAGLPVSFGALIVFAVTTAVLAPIAFFVFHDRISLIQFVGVALVIVGSWLVLGVGQTQG